MMDKYELEQLSLIERLDRCSGNLNLILQCCSTDYSVSNKDTNDTVTDELPKLDDNKVCENLMIASIHLSNPSLLMLAQSHYIKNDVQLKLDCFCCYLILFGVIFESNMELIAEISKIKPNKLILCDATGWNEDSSIILLEKFITSKLRLAILSNALKIFGDNQPSPLSELVEFVLSFLIEKDPQRREQIHRLAFVNFQNMSTQYFGTDDNDNGTKKVFVLMRRSWIERACQIVLKLPLNLCDSKSDIELLIESVEKSQVQPFVCDVLEAKKASMVAQEILFKAKSSGSTDANLTLPDSILSTRKDAKKTTNQSSESDESLPKTDEKCARKFHAISSSSLKVEDGSTCPMSDVSEARDKAENLEITVMRRLKRMSASDIQKPGHKDSLEKCADDLIEASDAYQHAGCYNKSIHCEKITQLLAVQIHLLPTGTNVINMRQQEASEFIIKSQNFHEAHIIAEAYNNHQAWCQAVFNQVVVRGDWIYLRDFQAKVKITKSFVEEILLKYSNYQPKGVIDPTQKPPIMSTAIQKIISLVPDVEYRCKISLKYELKEAYTKLLEDIPTRAYLKDRGCIE